MKLAVTLPAPQRCVWRSCPDHDGSRSSICEKLSATILEFLADEVGGREWTHSLFRGRKRVADLIKMNPL